MLVDHWGFCGICGEFVMSWIFERTLADTLKPDHAQVVEEYLTVRKLPSLKEVRAQIDGLLKPAVIAENRHQSAHWRMKSGGKGSNSSSKILGRSNGHSRKLGKHHGRKEDVSYYRRVSFKEEDQLMPTRDFWALFERMKDEVLSVAEMEKLSTSATPERIGVLQYMNSQKQEA